MKKRTTFMLGAAALLVGACAFTFISVESEPENPRKPASIPTVYESRSACEKQDILWEQAQASIYKELPPLQKLGLIQLLAMGKQELSVKTTNHSDFAPGGWIKYLHRRGALAKVKIVPVAGKYTGVFQGADCGLLRLSLTYKTAGSKPVAPGLALKVLRDKIYSGNISALVSLNGQDKDFNFFKNPMSNLVPEGKGLGQQIVHRMFRSVSGYPEELMASDMAYFDTRGERVKNPVAPRQIFFVPGPQLKFSSEEHDVREDFLSIPEGTLVYSIYLLSDKYEHFDYAKYKPENIPAFLKESQHVADIVTTSEFIASDFGDDGIFFRHQFR